MEKKEEEKHVNIWLANYRGKILKNVSKVKVRDDTKFGFSSDGPDNAPLTQCVICEEVQANNSMQPCQLWRQIETKDPILTNYN